MLMQSCRAFPPEAVSIITRLEKHITILSRGLQIGQGGQKGEFCPVSRVIFLKLTELQSCSFNNWKDGIEMYQHAIFYLNQSVNVAVKMS